MENITITRGSESITITPYTSGEFISNDFAIKVRYDDDKNQIITVFNEDKSKLN